MEVLNTLSNEKIVKELMNRLLLIKGRYWGSLTSALSRGGRAESVPTSTLLKTSSIRHKRLRTHEE